MENIKEGRNKNPVNHPGFLPQFLADLGATIIICGGMGMRAQVYYRKEITPIVGVTGKITEIIRKICSRKIRNG